MKNKCTRRLFAAALAALIILPTGAANAAAPQDSRPIRIYHMRTDWDPEEGTWSQSYLTDDAGRRVAWGRDAVAAASSLPSRYDLREKNAVTSVKDQGYTGNCWAFGAIAAAESNYILQGYGTAEDTDFSEAHLVWFSHRTRSQDSTDPVYGDGYDIENPYRTGGYWELNASAMMRGSGLVNEADAPWVESKNVAELPQLMGPDESMRYMSRVQVTDVESEWTISQDTVKQKILRNGAAALSFYYCNEGYSKKYHSLYQTYIKGMGNHTVCVVGWDDNFSRKQFGLMHPKKDGAWLIKNSWGTNHSPDGYYWLSYEDPSIVSVESYVVAPSDFFDNRYQVDATEMSDLIVGTGSAKMANIFTAKKAESLTHAVFFCANPYPMPVTVEVYVGSAQANADDPLQGMDKVDAATTRAGDVALGYRTVELKTPVTLEAGQDFAVVVTITSPAGEDVGVPVEGVRPPVSLSAAFSAGPGESFAFVDGKWQDTTSFICDEESEPINLHNVPVKALTRDLEEGKATLEVIEPPTRTEYAPLERADPAGIVLRFMAADGTETIVDSGYTCLTDQLTDYGEVPLIVSYRGLRASAPVRVSTKGLTLNAYSTADEPILYCGTTYLTAEVDGVPDGVRLFVRWDVTSDNGSLDRTYFVPLGSSIFIRATQKDAKCYHCTATLVNDNHNPISDDSGDPFTESFDVQLRCGWFARIIGLIVYYVTLPFELLR